MEVDHIQPLELGGAPYALSNLQTLARGCHIQKTKSDFPVHPEKQAWREYLARMC